MKFCVDYVKDFPYLKEVDELNISFNKRDLSLLDFLLLHKDKRINIEIRDIQEFIDDDSISLFKAYLEKYPDLNFYLKLPVSADFERFYSIAPPKVFSLEEALEYIKEDEYVEVTPHAMRLRKILLNETDRKRASK